MTDPKGEVIDWFFNNIYDNLTQLQSELKSKNKPDKHEINMMNRFIQEAQNQKDLSSYKQSSQKLKKYIELIEQERLDVLDGVDQLEKDISNTVYNNKLRF